MRRGTDQGLAAQTPSSPWPLHILSSTGRIPAWLQGTLLRNGPGMHTVGESRYNHWFDGLALLHSFTIRDGESAAAATAAVRGPRQQAYSLSVIEVRGGKWVSPG